MCKSRFKLEISENGSGGKKHGAMTKYGERDVRGLASPHYSPASIGVYVPLSLWLPSNHNSITTFFTSQCDNVPLVELLKRAWPINHVPRYLRTNWPRASTAGAAVDDDGICPLTDIMPFSS